SRDELGRGLDRQPGLAGAARPGEGEQACAITDLARNRLPLSLTTDEGARRPREVRVRDRPERGEGLVAELIDGDRGFDVLQAVLAEVGERVPVDQLTG